MPSIKPRFLPHRRLSNKLFPIIGLGALGEDAAPAVPAAEPVNALYSAGALAGIAGLMIAVYALTRKKKRK